jgi:hypothetical protein
LGNRGGHRWRHGVFTEDSGDALTRRRVNLDAGAVRVQAEARGGACSA